MSKSPIDYLAFWHQARDQEIGIYIETSNPILFRNHLYAAREAANELSLTAISVFIPAKPNTVMIVKQSVELDS